MSETSATATRSGRSPLLTNRRYATGSPLGPRDSSEEEPGTAPAPTFRTASNSSLIALRITTSARRSSPRVTAVAPPVIEVGVPGGELPLTRNDALASPSAARPGRRCEQRARREGGPSSSSRSVAPGCRRRDVRHRRARWYSPPCPATSIGCRSAAERQFASSITSAMDLVLATAPVVAAADRGGTPDGGGLAARLDTRSEK